MSKVSLVRMRGRVVMLRRSVRASRRIEMPSATAPANSAFCDDESQAVDVEAKRKGEEKHRNANTKFSRPKSERK